MSAQLATSLETKVGFRGSVATTEDRDSASADRKDWTFVSRGPDLQTSKATFHTAGWFLQVKLLVERDMKAELPDVVNKRNFMLNTFLAILTGAIWLRVLLRVH